MNKALYVEIHNENQKMLRLVLGGKVDPHKSRPITAKDASCLVSRAIDNEVKMLALLNGTEEK